MVAMPPILVSCDLHCLALEVVVCVPKTSSVFCATKNLMRVEQLKNYPGILRILRFFSSSFTRKMHHPSRPLSLPHYHRNIEETFLSDVFKGKKWMEKILHKCSYFIITQTELTCFLERLTGTILMWPNHCKTYPKWCRILSTETPTP